MPPEQTIPPPGKTPSRTRFSFLRFRLRTLMLVVTLSCFGVWGKLQYDWYCKLSLAAKWVEPLVKQPDGVGKVAENAERWGSSFSQPPHPPPKVSSKEELELLELAVLRLRNPKQRMAGLSILVEMRRGEVFPILRSLLAKSTHPEITAALVHLIGLQRNTADVPEFVRLLDHRDEGVRAAAAHALGYIHLPIYLHPREDSWREHHQHWLNVEPPIDIAPLLPSGGGEPRAAIALDSSVRTRLEQMMLQGTGHAERAAVASTLVNWPPEKSAFRYAEWGVWIDDAGELKLVQSVLDEIPPFVHQTGNPLKEFKNRITQIMAITKPVVHVTSTRPMAIDLEIQIRQGRPWYAFPRPDDFAFESGTLYGRYRRNANGAIEEDIDGFRSLVSLDPPNLAPLSPLAEGYSWRLPKHRSVGSGSGSMGAMHHEMASMGVRWQSLIVTPSREAWMVPPEVGDDPKFAWWKALRDVPSSWVSSHGETERFLYYDGPSFAHSPISVCSDGKMLWVLTQPVIVRQKHFHFEIGRDDCNRASRTGFFIEVRNNKVATQEFAIPGPAGKEVELDLSARSHSTQEALQEFLALLMKAGLTREEAGGLIVSWRKQFFETPGRWLLTILSREDYDEICPMRIRPLPQETARVGIVLSELDE